MPSFDKFILNLNEMFCDKDNQMLFVLPDLMHSLHFLLKDVYQC